MAMSHVPTLKKLLIEPMPTAEAISPPRTAPRMPATRVPRNPPGSSPLCSALAIGPAMRPRMISR